MRWITWWCLLVCCYCAGSGSIQADEFSVSPEYEQFLERYTQGEVADVVVDIQARLKLPDLAVVEREALQLLLVSLLTEQERHAEVQALLAEWLADPRITADFRSQLLFQKIANLEYLQRFGEMHQLVQELEQDQTLPEHLKQSLVWYHVRALQGLMGNEAALQYLNVQLATVEPLQKMALLQQRAALHDELGQPDLAEFDRKQAERMYQEEFPNDPSFRDQEPSIWLTGTGQWILGPWFSDSPVADLPLRTAVLFLPLLLLFVWKGNRQRIEANGKWSRLWCVAALLAVATLIPTLILWIAGMWLPLERMEASFSVWFLASLWLLFWSVQFLKPPISWVVGREALPEADPALTAEANELASKMGVSHLTVRLLPSVGAVADAYAGGLVAPSLVVGDGIMQRLEPAERSAILAHELGHVANHSLPLLALVRFLPIWALMLLAVWLNVIQYPLVWGLLLGIGMVRILSRRLEFDCDRRAAQTVGVPAMLHALSKIHMVHPLQNKGLWSLLAYATGTHPSRDERLQAIAELLPENASLDRSLWSPQLARQRQWLAVIMAVLWGLLVACAFVPLPPALEQLRTGVTLAAAISPWLLILAARRKDLANSQPGQTGWFWAAILFGAAIGLMIGLSEDRMSRIDLTGIAVLVSSFSIAAWLLARFQSQPARKILQLMQQRKFSEALAEADRVAPKLKRLPAVRHDVAIVRFLMRQDKQALQELRELQSDTPKFYLSWRGEALLLLELGRFQEALEAVDEVWKQHAELVDWRTLKIELLLRLNRTDEALTHLEWIRKVVPESPIRFLCEASWARGLGEREQAWDSIQEADRLAPGETGVACAQLRIALELGPAERVPELLERTEKLVQGDPFCLCQRRLERLREEWQARQSAAELEFVD